MGVLSATDLLAGGDTTFRVEVPGDVLAPWAPNGDDATGRGDSDDSDDANTRSGTVVLRPLLLSDLQLIARAAPESDELSSVLIVQRALVEPQLSVEQVGRMHAGLVEFLLTEVNRISGLSLGDGELAEAIEAPLTRACFTLSRHFGWTPDECAELTLGQVLLYLEMLKSGEGPWDGRTS